MYFLIYRTKVKDISSRNIDMPGKKKIHQDIDNNKKLKDEISNDDAQMSNNEGEMTSDIKEKDNFPFDKMNNKSPLRYPGGKTRACKILDDILKSHFDVSKYDTIVSPFFGGGSFEFYLQNKYHFNIIANDKFEPLYKFWVTCKLENEQLCRELTKHINLIDKEEFHSLRREIIDETNSLKQSVMYFIINRCSFSGATLSGGFSKEASNKRFTESSINKIRQLDLRYFDIHNLDFQEFIRRNKNKGLLFLDPPYYLEKASKLYGNNGDLHDTFDHEALCRCLSSQKNWIMTYNNCDYIKDLYNKFKIIETNWSYGMNKSKASSEIVIIALPE
jgi:DNA adenine methylase